MATTTAPAKTAPSVPTVSHPKNTWKQLAPLPDSVGFGGMFAGVLGGQLIAGGGSQFSKAPPWLKGEKTFSNRLFALDSPDGVWRELPARLPAPIAHSASATTPDAIYIAGGFMAGVNSAHVCRIRAAGNDFRYEPLADLPRPLAYAAAAIASGRLYVAGGQHDPNVRLATAETWSLDISGEPGATHLWRREPDLPCAATGLFVPAMASCGSDVYFIGGVGYDEANKSLPSAKVYRLAADATAWEILPEMPAARVGAATPCPVSGGCIHVIGGYANIFAGDRRDHPGFDAQNFIYDPAARRWKNGPMLPHTPPADKDAPGDTGPAPMVAAPAVVWHHHAIVISGEVRAGVRSPCVMALPL